MLTASEARPVCYRCMKPSLTCVCEWVPRVDNRTGVFVFQHPRERFHPIGTARFVRLGLERSRVETLWPNATLERPAFLPAGTALLYPSRNAEDLGELAPEARPRHLAVIDGTWHHARTLHRDTPWLRSLPHVRIGRGAPSRYRIRREPRPDYLSTLEAIVRALGILEPTTPGLEDLLTAFDKMIDRQIDLRDARVATPRRRARDPRLRGLPRAIVEQWERVVVVYGESSLMRYEGSRTNREILQWAAVRPATGAVFERLVRPTTGMCRPWHLGHMELSPRDLAGGASIEELLRAWRDFIEPDDVLVAWNQGILDLLGAFVGHAGQTLPLKSMYRSIHPDARGGVEDLIAREGLGEERVQVHGRAARRLGNAVLLVEHLRRQCVDLE